MHLTPERCQEEGIVGGRCLGTQTDLNDRPPCLLESCDHLRPPHRQGPPRLHQQTQGPPCIRLFGSPSSPHYPCLLHLLLRVSDGYKDAAAESAIASQPPETPGTAAPDILSGCSALTAWSAAQVWGEKKRPVRRHGSQRPQAQRFTTNLISSIQARQRPVSTCCAGECIYGFRTSSRRIFNKRHLRASRPWRLFCFFHQHLGDVVIGLAGK